MRGTVLFEFARGRDTGLDFEDVDDTNLGGKLFGFAICLSYKITTLMIIKQKLVIKAHQKCFETVAELTPYRPYSSIRKAEKINPVYKIPDPDFQGTTSNRSDNEVRFSEYGI